MRSTLFPVLLLLSMSGCSVVGAGIAVTSAAVTVGSAVVSTAVTVGSAAVRGAVKVGETVVDAATAPSSETPPTPAAANQTAALPATAEARPIEMQPAIDQRELPNRPPSIDSPCCSN